MATPTKMLLLLVVIYLAENVQAQYNFGIVEPHPENIYAIEGTSAEVTCVAFDSSGVKSPERIQFMRKNEYAAYTNLTASDNIYFTPKVTVEIDQGGNRLKKLIVTMHIRNVTRSDDSQYGQLGRYECHAFAVGDPTVRKHGFSVNVISKAEIPSVSTSKFSVLQHGENIVIFCNMTEGQQVGATRLKRISWFKDGMRKRTLRNPDPKEQLDNLFLELAIDRSGDGGNYTCLLEVLLRNVKPHNVSGNTMIEISPWIDKSVPVVNVTFIKGNNVTLECAAQGFPFHIEWKVKKDVEDSVQSCINGSDGKYILYRDGMYGPYLLNITDVQNSDLGSYYCCLPSNCSDNVQDNCQRFVLREENLNKPDERRCDSSSWKIAVYVEGALLVVTIATIVILVMKRRKKSSKEFTTRSTCQQLIRQNMPADKETIPERHRVATWNVDIQH